MRPNKYPIGTHVRVLSDEESGVRSGNGTDPIWGKTAVITRLHEDCGSHDDDPDYHIDIDESCKLEGYRHSNWWVYESQLVPIDDFDEAPASDISVLM